MPKKANNKKPAKKESTKKVAPKKEESVKKTDEVIEPTSAKPAGRSGGATADKPEIIEKDNEQEKKNKIVNGEEKTEFGTIAPVSLVTEMRSSYLDYAMSVIVQRALPDVRDGLKPVHRRILYAMWSLGLKPNAKFRKSATVVGEVLGKYHPHGDSSVYDAMARMAQDFSLRYMLVNGQGNFGSMDGDRPAAMRYTEAKLASISEELLLDIEKNTVDFAPNYDGSQQEPTVLPARLPVLLLNGALGIAVGMATNIPPHNLTELSGAIIHLLDNEEATVDDLMQFVKGPDFPTGGIIYDASEIKRAYATGRGGIVIRAKTEIVEVKNGQNNIIVTEIPYQVNKSELVIKIADLVKDKKIEGIKDLRDESDKDGVRIVVELKRDTYPKKILNSLFKHTSLQTTFHVNLIALVNGIQPKLLNLKMVLEEYIKHRKEVIKRRTQFELDKAKARAHILEGLMIALKNIDAVIKIIKQSKDKEIARVSLMKKFKLSEIQATAILEMRLQSLANLEQQKIKDELDEKKKLIKDLESILKSKQKVVKMIKDDLKHLINKFGDERRTRVIASSVKEFRQEDLVPNDPAVIIMTRDGYIKRVPPETFKVQNRGGKGVAGLTTKEEDIVEFFFTTMTHSDILFFTTKGRVFQLKAYDIPVASRTSKGQAIVNFLQLLTTEKVTTMLPLDKISKTEIKYLVMATEKGLVKKVELEQFSNVRRSGLIAIKVKDEDKLIWTKPTNGKDNVALITSKGQSIRFKETDVRPMGRNASGVTGIRLKKDDTVVGMGVIRHDPKFAKLQQLLVVSNLGFGKRSALGLYKIQSRAGSGIKTFKATSKSGVLANAFIVNSANMKEKDLVIISEKGQVIRLPFKSVPTLGRDTQGVRLMRFKNDGDKIANVTWV